MQPLRIVTRTLERHRRGIAELLSAPVDAAQVAASAARATTDPAARATHWDDALDRYRTAYELDWGRDRRFDGDRASLRQALADIAVELVDTHREAGRQKRREGSEDPRERPGPRVAVQRPTSSVHAR